KFTEKGSVKLDTFLTNIDDALSLTITVTDSGRGMTPEFLKSLFSPFTQEVDAKNTKGGTGLGLAIVKELVQYMCGKIEVSSEINKGSTFSVYIPITRGEEQALENKPLANIDL
ncbi:ATP-binding protein, partial [Cobetia sp. SIMBA_158]|uniref:ATP-binding protein n=1 Tax=Cobetia sp. SIMBA_158 TaxID=3081617 RepID=UPI003980FAD5